MSGIFTISAKTKSFILSILLFLLVFTGGCVLKSQNNSSMTGPRFTAISASINDYSIAVKTDGTVVCWGNNGPGVCDVPQNLTHVKSVSAGSESVIALKDDGTVVGWPLVGRPITRDMGQPPSDLSGVVAIDNTGHCALALKDDGTVVPWDMEGDCPDAQRVIISNLSGIVNISGDGALKKDGTVVTWDQNGIHRIPSSGNLTNIIAISSNRDGRNLAIRSDGQVVEWSVPGTDTLVPELTDIRAVSAGYNHNLAMKRDGTVISWNETSLQPIGLTNVTAMVSGDFFDLALKDDGTIVAWGSNLFGQLFTPGRLTDVKSISAGAGPDIVLKKDRTIVSWGWVENKQGHEPEGIRNVTGVLADWYETYILVNNESVIGWGEREYGPCPVKQIPHPYLTLFSACNAPFVLQKNGNLVKLAGNTTNVSFLHQLDDVTEVSSIGTIHTVALKKDGTVTVWGVNFPSGRHDSAVDVPKNLSDVVAISAGADHVLALRRDGMVTGWGDNSQGQLNIPKDLSDVMAISAGVDYSLALKRDGTVVAWGRNLAGECNVPEGLHDVIALSAGDSQALALKKDGTVVSWGAMVIPDWTGMT